MAQYPNVITAFRNAVGGQFQPQADANGNVLVHSAECINSRLNITAGAVVVKAVPGKVGKIIVTTAGSAPGSVSDVATTGAVAAGNLIFSIPNTVGIYQLNFPAKVGIIITAGTAQVLSVSFD